MGRAWSMNVGKEECIYDIDGKARRKELLGRPRHRWVDNIKMDLRSIEWCAVGWIDLAQGRDQWRVLVNTVMNLWAPYSFGKFLSTHKTGGFSRRAVLHVVC
jgi:hypothetical protein